jgi:hypothetical protein
VETLKLILQLLPLLLAIIREIQRRRLTAEATAEVVADLNAKAETLVARAVQARLGVDTSDEAIDADPNNRD